jgi:lysophospholipase L1-like esterase
VLLSPAPELIFIHLGGNDLCEVQVSKLRKLMSDDIQYLRDAFPETKIIWIDILPRRRWRGAKSLRTIDIKRKRINRLGRYLLRSSGKFDFITMDIDTKTNFFLDDGVHLNDVGLEFYLDYVKDCIVKNLPTVS